MALRRLTVVIKSTTTSESAAMPRMVPDDNFTSNAMVESPCWGATGSMKELRPQQPSLRLHMRQSYATCVSSKCRRGRMREKHAVEVVEMNPLLSSVKVFIECSCYVHQLSSFSGSKNRSFSSGLFNPNAWKSCLLYFIFLSSTALGQRTNRPSPAPFEPTPVPDNSGNVLTESPTGSPTSPFTTSPTTTTTAPTPLFTETPTINSASSSNATLIPTASPNPSGLGTVTPTTLPTLTTPSFDKGFYRQSFVIRTTTDFFNDTQQEALATVLESYTVQFAPETESLPVNNITECAVDDQSITMDEFNVTLNAVDYSCLYSSRMMDVSGFPQRLYVHINDNLENFTADMVEVGLPIEAALPTQLRLILSPAPSMSAQPSNAPSMSPSISARPSDMPSPAPTTQPSVLILPTTPPMYLRPTFPPTMIPVRGPDRLTVGAITTIVIMAGLVVLAGLFLYYRYWSKKRDENLDMSHHPHEASITTASGTLTTTLPGRSTSMPVRSRLRGSRPMSVTSRPTNVTASPDTTGENPDPPGRDDVLTPTDSLQSNKSLVSTGETGFGDDSGDEQDGTKNLQDEFDQYKDENLEQLRADVEGNLSGFEGIMSAAVTNALIGGAEETNTDTQDLLWGCRGSPNPDGTEIEASALFEVSDWLKRNESAGGERKRAFMQEILNKMVASVRQGVIVADIASRTIHESAAILGLQLADELPLTTVIISGMRKTTTADDMKKALQEFGDIDDAAVASGKRGFGILRFRRRKSVDMALQRYKSGEIVVLDVNIQMKVIMPSGIIESR